jgi:OOP family OmpA-OmpF porin
MFKHIAVAAALVIASSSALAQVAPQFYAGVDVGSTKVDGSDRENGFGGFVGYKFHPNFAVEAGYHRLAKANVYYYEDGIEAEGEGKFNQADISVIGTLPLSNGFSIFGRLGYNRLEIKGSATATGYGQTATESFSESESKVLYGAGLSYDFAPNVSGRVEVQKPHSDITKVAVGVSIGF